MISKGPFRSSPVVFSLRSQAIKSPVPSIFKLLNITVKILIKKKEEYPCAPLPYKENMKA
jgi:hypothetical protein